MSDVALSFLPAFTKLAASWGAEWRRFERSPTIFHKGDYRVRDLPEFLLKGKKNVAAHTVAGGAGGAGVGALLGILHTQGPHGLVPQHKAELIATLSGASGVARARGGYAAATAHNTAVDRARFAAAGLAATGIGGGLLLRNKLKKRENT